MLLSALAIFVAALLAAAVVTIFIRRHALHLGLLDRPNARSSHVLATPRGGGGAIVMTTLVAVCALWIAGKLSLGVAMALLIGGIAVAVIGWLDDLGLASIRQRFLVHVFAAAWAVYWVGGLPAITFGPATYDLGWFGDLLAVMAVIWTLNLFNFMDGIDGIAASEAAFITLSAAALGALAGIPSGLSLAALAVGAAALGFLLLNWPPAKIFMGDVGSGYLGFAIAVLALGAGHENAIALFVWLLLGGVFFVDATVTLVRRAIRGERLHEAHRSHAYQQLVKRWSSHRRVTLLVIVLNVTFLLPSAWIAGRYPQFAGWLTLSVFAALVLGAISVGAGRSEG